MRNFADQPPNQQAPHCSVDFYGAAAVADPVAAYHEMLALGPVVWLEKTNIHAICGYDAVTAALRNHRCFRSGMGVSINEDVNKLLLGSTLNSDPPQHDATRAITFAPLTPKALEAARASELMRDYIAPSLDTTISAIGYALMLFAAHPDQWRKLRNDRSLIRNAIEEIVRLNTPIKAFTRYVNEDTEVEGGVLPKGSRVLMVFGAANRDPSKFSAPDEFDIERSTRGHVGFGHGVHACLGMHLARLEISCLLNALADRVEQFELAGPVVTSINSSIYSFAQVPVRAIQLNDGA